jgi:hypothetical protein
MARAVEEALPVFDFTASHSRWIDASPDRVWAALTGLTFGQLSITRPLVAMRYVGSGSTPADRKPVRGRARRADSVGPRRVRPRRFALYWAVIRRPSGLVRWDMLRAVARAAEVSAASSEPA